MVNFCYVYDCCLKFRLQLLRYLLVEIKNGIFTSDKLFRLTPSVSVWNSCYRSCNSSWAATKAILDQELKSIKNAGTWKEERIITSRQDALISVEGKTEKVLNFCANNYLGLSSHPAVVEAGKKALDKYGAGLSSVRFICGTQDLHKELERKVAKFHGREEAILYASCFDANAGLFEVLLTPEDAVISDELNHASIIDGIRLCKAQKIRYQHRNMKELEEKLEESQGARLRLIATDGVFSMDGNVTPLRNICDLAEKYKAMVFVDECHATGFFGRTGRGTEEYFNLTGRVDIINSTLGKALGGAAGGYTTGKKEVIELLRQRSRPYLFSNTLPPPVVACASKGDDHPICPVMLGDARLASVFAEEMLERGIYVIGFSFPVVPKGKARIRVQISAAHSEQDIDKTVDAFLDVGKKLKVI
ncbi:2-amino-3-ketobutyrate coenzyme A ligase, mitochondrial-like isoform X3 [Limulus polyphemus]|uniref:2-amino-3-ketobutyrate coenzyme A ligase, mitochondrial-like isoform X3 n=1 Tax=Limulus polyphemus TaxID=6850 RepID=A0ABM1SZ28_LIMPO|nr:2-amino-3-ketobutyrate coenzyme A ligase, mitochondrial-like isoform X3 [Limulus polyphemus]